MNNRKLSEEEINITKHLSNKKLQYLIELGEIKLSEIKNKNLTEQLYFNLTELNTREEQFKELLMDKYGEGYVDLSTGEYKTE